MTKNEAYQDPLNFGIRINNRLAFLMADQQRGDYPPTDQAEDFRKEVTEEMDKELGDLQQLYNNKLEELNRAIQEKGLRILEGKEEVN